MTLTKEQSDDIKFLYSCDNDKNNPLNVLLDDLLWFDASYNSIIINCNPNKTRDIFKFLAFLLP